MLFRRARNANLFHGRLRSERSIVYGGQVWAFVILVLALSLLTTPLWLISPPAFMGTKQEFRLAGAAFWAAAAVLALFAGRSWGLRIVLNIADRTVSRVRYGPRKMTTLWRVVGDQVSYVSLTVNPQGVGRLEAWLKDGSALLVERGVNVVDLKTLGKETSECWGAPFRT